MPINPLRQTQRARALRSGATDAERKLWHILSAYRPRFTRQFPIGAYIADFACRAARVAIELDGSQHVDSAYDERRTADLEALGWRVVRFWNHDVLGNVEGVVEAIIAAAEPRLPPGETFAAIASRAGRERTPRTRARTKGPPPTPPGNPGGE